jgi:hypothetical protein
MQDPPPHADPRLAAVTGDDGAIDRDAVKALLSRHPSALTLPEIEAMHTIFFEIENEILEDHPLAGVTYEGHWLDVFVEIVGGTITREKVRHGKTVQRSVRRHRGRADVRRYRAELQMNVRSPARRASRAREHRPAATRRASSSSSTSSADPGDPEPEPEPLRLAPAPRAVLTFGCLSAEARGAEVEETGR